MCRIHVTPLLFFVWCFSSDALWTANHGAITPIPLTAVYQLPAESSRAERARRGKPTPTTLTFRCDQTAHQWLRLWKVLRFNRTPSTSPAPPPTWYLIVNLPVSLIFTFHFPQTGRHFHGNWSGLCTETGWSCACVSAYMSVVVHLCLHRLKQWQSPNWIRAYGKVGEGRADRRRPVGGTR